MLRAWGAGKWGWFTATCRNPSPLPDLLVPRQRFRKGEWKSILDHAEQARLWDLPTTLPPAADFIIDDGTAVLLEMQDSVRYHQLARHAVLEPGLARTVNYLLRASTAFERELAGEAAHYWQQVEPLPRLQAPAEPAAE